MADNGKLVVVLAGTSAAVDRVTPYCDGMCVKTTKLPLINCCCSEAELTSRGNHRIGRETIELRDREPGMATLLKVTGNTFVLSMVGFIPPSSHYSRPPNDDNLRCTGVQVETLAEGHVFAEKTGLGSEALHKFLEAMLPGPLPAYSTRMISGDYMRDQVRGINPI